MYVCMYACMYVHTLIIRTCDKHYETLEPQPEARMGNYFINMVNKKLYVYTVCMYVCMYVCMHML